MIPSHSQPNKSQPQAGGHAIPGPQLEEELYDTFLKMRDLLEDYAPSWYSEDLRKKAETVVRRMVRASFHS